jgi:divalent metal cation (Fe/Co/Zn/Cd) transporter
MGGLFSVREGVDKLNAHEPLSAPWLAIGVLLFSIAAEVVSLVGCLREVNKVRGGRTLWRWFRESRQSELIVVLGEDIAALLGLVLALGAVGLTLLTGDPLFDGLGSVAIGALLILIALALTIEIKGLLIGQSVESSLRHAIQETIMGREEVEHVLNLITLQLGTDVMVAVKAKMRNVGSALEVAEAINRCERTLREAFPQVKWVFFEPDLADGSSIILVNRWCRQHHFAELGPIAHAGVSVLKFLEPVGVFDDRFKPAGFEEREHIAEFLRRAHGCSL